MNRPALSDLAAAGSITTRPNGGSVTFGNPNLKPYKATSIETSLEYYMGKGFASIGGFYKKMDSFVTSRSFQEPYGQIGLPTSLLIPGEDANTLFDVSQPVNRKGADIKGIEVAFQHDFDFLPGALKHLGISANGTWFDGHQTVNLAGTDYRVNLFNLSKWAANATLYYDTDRWGARISTGYRSRYLIGAGGGSPGAINVGDLIKGGNNVDAQAHFNLTKRLKLIAEAINLTNQPIVQTADINAERTEVFTKSGRTFTFGFSADL